MASPTSLKRTSQDAGLDFTPGVCAPTDTVNSCRITQSRSTNITNDGSLPSSSPDTSHPNVLGLDTDAASDANSVVSFPAGPAPKRRKLTIAEREAKRLEKETRDKEKAEEKARKDEEKVKKDEEKRLKDLEKEDKQKAKEAEKQAKEVEKKRKEAERQVREEEKQKKDDEKHEKEKKQLRLNSFFFKPPLAGAQSRQSPRPDGEGSMSSRRSSVVSLDEMEKTSRSRSTSATPLKAQAPNYEQSFPPFFLQSHTRLAPQNRFSRGEKGLQHAKSMIDESLRSNDDNALQPLLRTAAFDARELFHLAASPRRVYARMYSVKDIIGTLHGSATTPIGLTLSNNPSNVKSPRDSLENIPIKYIRFAEDIRPPYIGTWTGNSPLSNVKKLCRNPCSPSLPNTDYDYDSEAEWEELGEGEDLDSEGEKEVGEDEEGDEMEGFLDDEDTGDGGVGKRRPLMGTLEPTCTGLRWEGLCGEAASDLQQYKLDYLFECSPLPINPYSTAYWPSAIGPKSNDAIPYKLAPGHMEPPRIPLNVTNRTNTMVIPSKTQDGKNFVHTSAVYPDQLTASRTPKKLVAPELMVSFKQAIQGSDLTKAGLIEVLKKQFPKQSKDAIKDTLGLVAERIGSKEADKRWIVKSDTPT